MTQTNGFLYERQKISSFMKALFMANSFSSSFKLVASMIPLLTTLPGTTAQAQEERVLPNPETHEIRIVPIKEQWTFCTQDFGQAQINLYTHLEIFHERNKQETVDMLVEKERQFTAEHISGQLAQAKEKHTINNGNLGGIAAQTIKEPYENMPATISAKSRFIQAVHYLRNRIDITTDIQPLHTDCLPENIKNLRRFLLEPRQI